jgi:hypothetical protein
MATLSLLSVTPDPALAQGAPAIGHAGDADQAAPFGEDDLLLLEVQADGIILTDSLGAYGPRSATYLPLGAVARLLDLDIVVMPLERRAMGSVLTPDRTFMLDLATREARLGDMRITFGTDEAVPYADDIYVTAELLSRLLPVDFVVDRGGLALTLKPRETLPFAARLERERRGGTLAEDAPDAPGEAIEQPFLLWSPPAFDVALDGGLASEQPRSRTRYDLRAAGDLLYANAQLYLGSDDDGRPQTARVLLERKDPGGFAIGGVTLTRAALGDTYTPNLAVGPSSGSGRGILLSSEALEQATIFNRSDFRGELQLGYQVELYVNEVLRGTQLQAVDGRYEFLGIPLAYGLNVIRLVFYGPRGERREQVRRLNVGGGQLAPGQLTFAMGLVQQQRSVVSLGDDTIPDPDDGKYRLVVRAALGLSTRLTLSGGLATYSLSGKQRGLATIGARTELAGAAVQADVAADDRGGTALVLGLAGRFAGISTVLRHAEYRGGFQDENNVGGFSPGRLLDRSSNLRADASLRLGISFPVSLELQRDQYRGGETFLSAIARLSAPIRQFYLSNTVLVQHRSTDAHGLIATGAVDLSGRIGLWQVRGGLTYDIRPRAKVQQAFVSVDRSVLDRLSFRLAAARQFGPEPSSLVQAGLTRRMRWADVAVTGSYDFSRRDYRLGLQLAFGLTFDPIARRYRPARPGVASSGSLALRAFIDRDADGVYGANDTPVPGLRIRSGGIPVTTGSGGDVLVTGLGDGTRARVEADLSALDDPYLTATSTRYTFVPRPGRTATKLVAIASFGEVMLRARLAGGADARGISALALQLVDEQGRVAGAGRTEYDGSLLVERLRPGRYSIAIDPEQAARLHLRLAEPRSVVVPAQGGFAGQVDVTIERAEGAQQ